MIFCRTITALLLVSASIAASAGTIIYDFSGTGEVCDPREIACYPGLPFTGTLTLTVNPDAPVVVTGDTAFSESGWVVPFFEFDWDRTGTFAPPGPFSSQSPDTPTFTSPTTLVRLSDGYRLQTQSLFRIGEGPDPDPILFRLTTELFLRSPDPLLALVFPEPIVFSPGTVASIDFARISIDVFGVSGLYGSFLLSSFEARPVAVSEPSTLALAGVGLAFLLLAFVRRRQSVLWGKLAPFSVKGRECLA
jgi:hypothetical protein